MDAISGELLAFQDINTYVQRKIIGSIYPFNNTECEDIGGLAREKAPMIFIDAMPWQYNVILYTNLGGLYNHQGIGAGTTLSGKYVKIKDKCCLDYNEEWDDCINENSKTGDIDLGGETGDHDRDIPDDHNIGDTMAARTCFVEINHLKLITKSWVYYSQLDEQIKLIADG